MNPLFRLIPVLLMFTLIPAFYGALIKLSARILRYQAIPWKQGYAFGIILVLCSALMRTIFWVLGQSIPFVPGILLGLTVNWLVGSWYFSGKRAKSEEGKFGWSKALRLTGLAIIMVGLMAGLLIGVGRMLSRTGIS